MMVQVANVWIMESSRFRPACLGRRHGAGGFPRRMADILRRKMMADILRGMFGFIRFLY